jgi:hypothetical protein
MKKFILFSIFIGNSLTINAQNSLLKNDAKSFISKVAYAKQVFEPNVENSSLTMEYTRHIKIKVPTLLVLHTKRIRQIHKSELHPVNIDTDKPFAGREIEKGLLEHYLTNIETKIEVDISKKQTKRTTMSTLWLARLPMLNPVQELSGILVEQSTNKNNWSDTLQTLGSIFINHYTIENDSTLKLVGESAPKQKMNVEGATTDKELSDGESVEAKSSGKQQQYTATIKYNKQTGFITRMDGEIKTQETLSVMGQTIDQNVRQYFVVENTEVRK